MRVTDNELISALLTCSTIKVASEKVGLTEQGIYARLKKPEFKEKLQEQRTQQFQVINSKLQDANFKALDKLIELIEDENTPSGIQLKASQCILDLSLKSREQLDILERLEDLEEQLKRNYS